MRTLIQQRCTQCNTSLLIYKSTLLKINFFPGKAQVWMKKAFGKSFSPSSRQGNKS